MAPYRCIRQLLPNISRKTWQGPEHTPGNPATKGAKRPETEDCMEKEKLDAAIALKDYWRDNDRFADLFNQILFGGREVIMACDLTEGDSDESMLINHPGGIPETTGKYRDVVKTHGGQVNLAIYGIENQKNVHLAMPVRGMVYDGLNYAKQCKALAATHKTAGMDSDEFLSGMKRGDRLLPAVNLVIYYGEEHDWDGPTRLSEMMDVPEHIRPFFNDYRLNILNVRSADGLDFKNNDNRNLFAVAKYLYERGKNINVKDFDEAFPDMRLSHETAAAIAAATGSMVLLENMKGKTKKEEIVMCKALEALVQRGEEQGMEKGMENLNQLYGYLLNNNMLDELRRSVVDADYQRELLRTYVMDDKRQCLTP